MIEADFKRALKESLLRRFPEAFVWCPADRMTSGLPDVMAAVPSRGLIVCEAKQLLRLLEDPRDAGRRRAPLLHHPFEGPQISTLRRIARAGQEAWGLVRITSGHAVRVAPDKIPSCGNFTHEELLDVGTLVTRGHGMWPFWTGEADA